MVKRDARWLSVHDTKKAFLNKKNASNRDGALSDYFPIYRFLSHFLGTLRSKFQENGAAAACRRISPKEESQRELSLALSHNFLWLNIMELRGGGDKKRLSNSHSHFVTFSLHRIRTSPPTLLHFSRTSVWVSNLGRLPDLVQNWFGLFYEQTELFFPEQFSTKNNITSTWVQCSKY